MEITYKSNEQVVKELKKLMIDERTTQREIADKLGLLPQGITKILNKKNFGFEDVNKILSVIGYEMVVSFRKKEA